MAYSHIESQSYHPDGTFKGLPIDVVLPESDFDYGISEATLEVNRLFLLPNGDPIMPYVKLGVQYEFERPNGGQILTGDLSLATPDPWTMTARAGARLLAADNVLVEANPGYLSFGQNGLDIWEGMFRISIGF